MLEAMLRPHTDEQPEAIIRHRTDKQPEHSGKKVVVLSCDRFRRRQVMGQELQLAENLLTSSPAFALHQNQFPSLCTSYFTYPLGQKYAEDLFNVRVVNRRRFLIIFVQRNMRNNEIKIVMVPATDTSVWHALSRCVGRAQRPKGD